MRSKHSKKIRVSGDDLVSKVLVSKTEGLEFNPQNSGLKKIQAQLGGSRVGAGEGSTHH